MNTTMMLILSTGHLPQKEFESLGLGANPTFRFINHEYGAILVLHDTLDDPDEHKETKNNFPILWQIINHCITNGIQWINFDQDGDLYDEFEQFDW